MRTISTTLEKVYAGGSAKTSVKIEIDRDGAGTWVDMSALQSINWITTWQLTANNDSPTLNLKVSFRVAYQRLSLSPFDTNSRLNSGGVLVHPYRKIRMYVATLAAGVVPATADWSLIFRGRIFEVNWDDDELTAHCRDEGGDLMDLWMKKTLDTYRAKADVSVETLSQNLLTDTSSGVTLYSTNGTGGTPFAVADSPSWTIKADALPKDQTSVDLMLQRLWSEIGWDVRYKWQVNRSDFELVAYQPSRTTPSVVRTFGADDYYTIANLAFTLANIRNYIRVAYFDTSGNPQTHDESDATSITLYGERFMQVAEEATSNIRTSTQANLMAEAILSDLKNPTVPVTITMPFFWPVELGDYYTFSANQHHFSSDQSLAVAGYVHTGAVDGPAKTEMVVRGVSSSGENKWILMRQLEVIRQFGGNNIKTPGRSGVAPNPYMVGFSRK